MGQQISAEEKQQFSLHFWKSCKYRLISGVIQLHRGWNIQTRNFLFFKKMIEVNLYTKQKQTYLWLPKGKGAERWIVALQAPLSMAFSRQEYWSG